MVHIGGQGRAAATYSRLAKSGLGLLGIRKSHAILSAAFTQAARWGWIDRNPVDQASPPPARAPEIRPPTPEQLQSLLAACMETHPEAGTGARTR